MKTLFSISFFVVSSLLLLSFTSANNHLQLEGCSSCDSSTESIEFTDLPYFEQADWYESWDLWYGTHQTSWISFSDNYKGKIFRGGMSGKFFIGDSSGGKYYYISQRATVRALYLYKRYKCISTRYRY